MPQTLACRYSNKGGQTEVQPLRNVDGAFFPLGNPYVPGQLATDPVGIHKSNLVIGSNGYFFCSAGREIRVLNYATNNWDLMVTYGFAATNDSPLIQGRGPTGTPRLAVVYRNISNRFVARTLDTITPGGVWNAEIDSGISDAANEWPTKVVKINNNIWTGGSAIVAAFNMATDGFFTQSGFAVETKCHTRVGNRIFILNCVASANQIMDLHEFQGGGFVNVLDADGTMPRLSIAALPSGSDWACMFHDEATDALIVFAWQETASAVGGNPGGSGMYVVSIDIATLAVTNITPTVAPGGLAAPGGPDPNNDVRFTIEVDSTTNPLAPDTYIWVCVNNGAWSRFRWNGAGAAMTAFGSGGNRGIAVIHNPNGGGEYNYSGSTTANPAYRLDEVAARVALPGRTRLTLQCVLIDETGGSPTPTDEVVGLYWGREQRTADNLCTIANATKLSGPGSAPTIVGNKIQNFTCGDGSVYQVEWVAGPTGDLLTDQDQVMVEPRVEL